jgi:hypothetical protein
MKDSRLIGEKPAEGELDKEHREMNRINPGGSFGRNGKEHGVTGFTPSAGETP